MSLVQKAFDGVSQAFFKEDHGYFRELIGKADKDKIELYLKKFPQAAHWTFASNHDYTTIHEAVMARRYDLIPLFQQYGVDINQPTKGGEPPLCWVHGKDDIDKLVALGAVMDDPRWTHLTPLMRACLFARVDEVEGLLEHGADVHKVINDPQSRFHGQTALQIASRFTDDMGPDDMSCGAQALVVEKLLARGGHSLEELQLCRTLAGNWTESAAAGKLLQAAVDAAEAEKALAEQKAIEGCVHGLPENTTVRRPIVLRKP